MTPLSVGFSRRLGTAVAGACLLAVSPFAHSQEPGSVVSEKGIATPSNRFRLRAEIKVNVRSSASEQQTVPNTVTPFPVILRVVNPYTSFEVSNVALIGEGDLTPDISAKAEIHFLDLYNRNPTSSDDRVSLREAWIRFGKKYEAMQPMPGTSVYLQVGKAPRFSKQIVRRLESYGLWGTAVGRFEELGAEAGGSFGKNVYWRAAAANGNPLFMRDPNALAGDNGTPERTIGGTMPVVYESGFPILYDAKTNDVNFRGQFQYGGGLGLRFNWGEENRNGVDVLGWYFRRTLADRVSISGSFYSGDLRLLQGFGPSLPIDGNEKVEYGGNLEVRLGRFSLYGQYVRQTIAGLVRKGFEVEAAYRIPLNGLFVSGDSPVLNWIAPTVRISSIDDQFGPVSGYVAPSFFWDWRKYDAGLRIGIVRGVDLTLEYSRHDMILVARVAHPDEGLLTLRAGF